MSTRIALRNPSGAVVRVFSVPADQKRSSGIRRAMRQHAAQKCGARWHTLWQQGWRVGSL